MKHLSRWTSNRYIIYTVHVLFWILLMFPYFMGPKQPPYFQQGNYRMIFNHAFVIILFYFNAYYLFPEIYKKKGWLPYLLSIIASIIIMIYASGAIRHQIFGQRIFPDMQQAGANDMQPDNNNNNNNNFPRPNHPPDGLPLPIYIFIIGISFSYRLISDQNIEEKKRKEQETETLKTELTFLRSQISPHFMFNVLNTLVALARKKSDLMEPSLIQLSTLMRYVLYESNNNRINLSKEVEYLKNYVELQALRFGDDLNLILDITEDTEGYVIEPMLLIPFVENAFKHGLGNGVEAPIHIHLSIDHLLSALTFRVENEVAPVTGSKDSNSGIGLKNVCRRLELLYKDKHTLSTQINNNIFTTNLMIELR